MNNKFRNLSLLDKILSEFNYGLNVLYKPIEELPSSFTSCTNNYNLLEESRDEETSGKVMHVNYIGEICAQALYRGQAFTLENSELRTMFLDSASDELRHLEWCQSRMNELGTQPSILSIFWYANSFILGSYIGTFSESINLGFISETELQVERHLNKYIQYLPEQDKRSKKILRKMRFEEKHHRKQAERHTLFKKLEQPIPFFMKVAALLMVTISFNL